MVYQKQLVVVLAPAKLNLSLDVAGLLPNGYHDLDMVMQTIDLYERITLASHLMGTYAVQSKICGKSKGIKCLRMKFFYIILDIFQCDSAYTTYGSCKVTIDHILGNSDCLKDLRSLIRLDSGNTHLGSNLYDTMQNCCIVIIHCGIIIFVKQSFFDQFPDTVLGQIWVDCTGTIT